MSLNPADLAAIRQSNLSAETLEANRRTVEAKAEAALTDMGKVAADTANPPAVRAIAKAVRLTLRLVLDRYDGTD